MHQVGIRETCACCERRGAGQKGQTADALFSSWQCQRLRPLLADLHVGNGGAYGLGNGDVSVVDARFLWLGRNLAGLGQG
jgi:hypothetical protein